MKHTITAALGGPAPREDAMLGRDPPRSASATALLTATIPVRAREPFAVPNGNPAEVNDQQIFHSLRGAGEPLIVLHGGINPDSSGSNLAELAKGRRGIAVRLQAHGRTPDSGRPLRGETLGDDVALGSAS
jgi:pimeloyl-ACP methyl ester carboxylesterase